MNPDSLVGSYQRYKEDTNVFTTWLSKAAAVCGYISPRSGSAPLSSLPKPVSCPKSPAATNSANDLSLAEKLRAQAEKKAKKREEKKEATVVDLAPEPKPIPTMKHAVKTQELLRQAEAVSKRSKTTIPDAIMHVVERAIQARKRCSDWFERTGIDNGQSTNGHRHFIEILEQTLKILKPDYTSKGEPPNSMRPKIPATPQKTSSFRQVHDLSGLSNRFSNLQVEDIEESAETTLAIEAIAATPNPKLHKAAPGANSAIDVFELDYDDSFDQTFDVFCFFEDLHRVQDFLNETWSEYKKGELDLMTAAIVTNGAFDLVQREEHESPFFFAESLRSGDDSLRHEQLRITPFDNFIFLSTARSITKFEKFLGLKIEYPQPVPPSRASYFFEQEMLRLPEIQRMEKEDEFLSQYLMDLSFRSKTEMMRKQIQEGATPKSIDSSEAFKQYQTVEAPSQDELSRGFERMRVKGEISTWFVFACRVLIDLQDILGDKISEGWALLQETAAKSKENLHARVKNDVMIVDGERWRQGHGDDIVMKLWTECTMLEKDLIGEMKRLWIKERYPDGLHRYFHSYEEAIASRPELAGQIQPDLVRNDIPDEELRAMREKAKEFNLQPIPPNQETSFIHNRNPVYCGFRLFELYLDNEAAGIFFENHHKVLFYTSHLYNAAVKTGLLQNRWPEMDFVIQTHMGMLFAGQTPENERQFSSRFSLQLGLSTSKLTRNARTNRERFSKDVFRTRKPNGPEMANVKETDIFRQYFSSNKTLEQCLHQLQTLVGEESISKSKSKTVFRTRYHRQLTPIQLLMHTRSSVPDPLKKIQIDYISLVRTCSKLLRLVRIKLHVELGKEVYDKKPNEDSDDDGLLRMTLGVLNEAADVQKVSEEIFRKEMKIVGPIIGGPQLQATAEVMDKFIGKFVARDEIKTIPAEKSKPCVQTLEMANIEVAAVGASQKHKSWETSAAKFFV